MMSTLITALLLLLFIALTTTSAFQTSIVPQLPSSIHKSKTSNTLFIIPSPSTPSPRQRGYYSSSKKSTALNAGTIDPAVVIGQAAGTLINSPFILAVPIFGGVTVALVVVLFIVKSAAPTDPDV